MTTTHWYLSFELTAPVPDENLDQVRTHLIDTLAAAGYTAKTTTADWGLVQLSRTPAAPFRPPNHFGVVRNVHLRKSIGARGQ